MKKKSGKSNGGLVKAGDVNSLKEQLSAGSATLAPRETPGPHPPVKPTDAGGTPQMNLFQNFLTNRGEERDQLSNAIDLWDGVPRYSVSQQAMNKSRASGSILRKHTAIFHYMKGAYQCTITPARVTDLDGEERDYYPSANEELVEDALRKLAADQQAGFFDKSNFRSGVVFSLYALREELAKRGKTRSYQEVRRSLDIMSSSIIEIRGKNERGEELYVKSAFLPSVVAVSRAQLKDDPNARWAIQFHPLVTASIDKLAFRQFNYDKMMSHNTHLARWLHKQIVLKWTAADLLKPFEVRYSTVKRDSGLLSGYKRERAAIDALRTAFGELESAGLIASCERHDVTGPRKKLLDVIFKVWPSLGFVREAKAANTRQLAAKGGAR